MNDFIGAMQNVDAGAFLVLGVGIAIAWLRRRDESAAWLAGAIVLLSAVFVLGQLLALLKANVPVLSDLDLVFLAGAAYALLRYRSTLIPLSRTWHVTGAVAIALPTAAFAVATLANAPAAVSLWIAIALLLAWAAVVLESIVRFLLVAQGLPAVQAWRLRSVAIAFAGIVCVFLFATVLAGAHATSAPPAVVIAVQVAILLAVPLLYAGFSPPAWLRRGWRAAEEQGLREYLEASVLRDGGDANAESALGWAMRLTGAGGAVTFDSLSRVRASAGADAATVQALQRAVGSLRDGVDRADLGRGAVTVATMTIVAAQGAERLVLIAGPFSPSFGGEELNRVQQFMTAVVAGSERKRLVEELKATNVQLKEASEHKSVFLANMSHELRTPLNAIIGFSELLLDSAESHFDEATQTRFLAQIHTSGKHLLGLINDILDLSKVEAGQMELRLQTLAVDGVVAQVVSTIEPLAAQKQITVVADAAGAGEITVDGGKLKQMLLNLLSNAIKFTADGGSVTIKATRGANAIDIAVTDTGIGIAKEDQPRIFREFQQLDTGPGRREQGTGLGLALTRRFAQLHGGDVTVSSDLGHGSIFTLHLPIGTPEKTGDALGGGSVPGAAGLSTAPLVLVIEDDPGAAELLTRQLSLGGFRTSVIRSGNDALASARALHPAAITLDILLPDVDGWEVMSRLKADPATSDIPVIVVSVIDNPDLGMALGALDYFVKPVDGRQLVERLRRIKRAESGDRPPTVLVVDDEAANRHWLSRILEPAGFDITLASGGREAIDHARSTPPDVVILDLMMPEVTGFDVVKALRADTRTRETPILILTARHLTDDDKRELNGHVSTILSRGSVGASDLVGLLRRVVDETGAEAAV